MDVVFRRLSQYLLRWRLWVGLLIVIVVSDVLSQMTRSDGVIESVALFHAKQWSIAVAGFACGAYVAQRGLLWIGMALALLGLGFGIWFYLQIPDQPALFSMDYLQLNGPGILVTVTSVPVGVWIGEFIYKVQAGRAVGGAARRS